MKQYPGRPRAISCLLFIFSLGLGACGGPDTDLLPGTWQAVAWTDETMEIQEPAEVAMAINFQADKRYSAQLSGGQPEAGRYYTVRNNIFVTDTTVEKPAEKPVQIARLTPDSLYLRFGPRGSTGILVFVRRQ